MLLLASAAIFIPFWFSLGTFRPDSLDGRSSPTPTPVDFANSTRANDPEFWSLVDEAVVQCQDRFHHSKRSPLNHATAIERDDEPIRPV